MKTKFLLVSLLLWSVSINGAPPSSDSFIDLGLNGDWQVTKQMNEGSAPSGWRQNSKRNDGKVIWIPMDGGFIPEISGNDGAEAPFHLYTGKMFSVKEGNVVKGKVSVRGEGELSILVYLYNLDGENIGATKEVTLPVPEGDSFVELDYEQVISSTRKGAPKEGRLAISVPPGAKIQIRSITASINAES